MTTTPRFHAFAGARRCLSALALAATPALLGTALPAGASAPAERVTCTTEPRSRWMSEAQVKRLFGVDKYVLVKFKVSRANCYEFYAVGREGGVVEAYYHPITGRLMKENRVGTEPRPGP